MDFDGTAADPDDVISQGLDGGCQERSEELREVLRDPGEDPAGRFLACVALTRWADAAGYEAVFQAARSPESVVWRGASYDRLHGQDDTFGVLADVVGDSADMVEERGTAADRVQAAEALINVGVVAACLPVLKTAVDRGIARLAEGRLSYDLGLQLALMITAAHRVDAMWALDAARRLIAAKPGERALTELRDAFPEAQET